MAKDDSYDKAGMKTVAVIPAAGAGTRMGVERAKQFLKLGDSPLLALTLEKFQSCSSIAGIILVAPSEDLDYCEKSIINRYNFNKVRKIIAGGERRQDSVRLGIEASEGEYGLVLIHDGVRPFIETGLIQRAVDAAMKDRAVITALPAKDTAKKIDEGGYVIKTYERRLLWMVQTPQVFRYEDILAAHRKALLERWDDVTDDALLIEKMGIPVRVILGSEYNIKITTPNDLELARLFMDSISK